MSKTAFRQCDIQRLIRAAKAEGFEHPSVETRPDGSLRLLTEASPAAPLEDARANEWDEVLPR